MGNQKSHNQSIILDEYADLQQQQKTALPFLGIVFFVTLFISIAMSTWIMTPHSLVDYAQSFLWAILFSNLTLFMAAFVYHRMYKYQN